MNNEIWLWVGFNLFVLAMLALDLGVFHRQAHEVKIKEALGWSALWIGLSLVFNLIVWRWRGSEVAMEFLSAYLLEKALSVDNIFVFIIIFSYFKVPAILQHKVLFWGIISALVMRAACIAAGITLLKQFHWLIYVFGAFLILTGIKMALSKGKEIDPGKNPILSLLRRLLPVTDGYEGDEIFRTSRCAIMGDAIICHPDFHRADRSGVRCRFDSRRAFDYTRPVHRLHLERFCDFRFARAVFCAGRCDWLVPLFALRAFRRAGFRGYQDVDNRSLQNAHHSFHFRLLWAFCCFLSRYRFCAHQPRTPIAEKKEPEISE